MKKYKKTAATQTYEMLVVVLILISLLMYVMGNDSP